MPETLTADAADPQVLAESIAHCHEVTRSRARNFYHGLRLTPEPKRSALYAIYAWNREADDIADDPEEPDRVDEQLDQFRRMTNAVVATPLDGTLPFSGDSIWPAFHDAVQRYRIPSEYLQQMIDGQRLDLRLTRYQSFEQLYEYCYKVASVVGMTCIEVWGYEGGEETRKLSEQRGIAFQLTNILRDVREDADRDRVYLPAELCSGDVEPEDVLGEPQGRIVNGLRDLAQRAMTYYETSEPLNERVHPDGRACLWAMTRIYRGLLEKILRDPQSVLSPKRVRLSGMHKAWIAMRASLAAKGVSG